MSTLPPPVAKRQSTTDWYKTFETHFDYDEDGDIIVRHLTEAEQQQWDVIDTTLQESENFRCGAASTHDRLDRHLMEYRKSCTFRLRGERKLPAEVQKDLVESNFQTAVSFLCFMLYKLTVRSFTTLGVFEPLMTSLYPSCAALYHQVAFMYSC